MNVRCKLRLIEKTPYDQYGNSRLVFEAQYDESIPEDQRFFDATPSARFEILVNNKAALEAYQVGQCYYFDSSPAPV